MRFVAATSNRHKMEEFRAILEPLGVVVVSAEEMGFTDEIEETGSTFAENAAIKARAIFKATGLPVFADDSGLCVDALDGRPGVFSARYGGGIPHSEKIKLLLSEMEDVPDDKRTARFTCVVHCIMEDGIEISVSGFCEGVIGWAPAGDGGFGYDPVFFRGNKSMAQINKEEKNEISHRGQALREMARMAVRKE